MNDKAKVAPQRRSRRGMGSVTRRSDGRWHGRFTRPDGSRGNVYGGTQDETIRTLDKARREAEDGLEPMDGRTPVSAYLDDWLERIRPSIGLRTGRVTSPMCEFTSDPDWGTSSSQSYQRPTWTS